MYIWKDPHTGRRQLVLTAQVIGILPPRYAGGSWRFERITGTLPAPLARIAYRWAVRHNARYRRWYQVGLKNGYTVPGSLPWGLRRRMARAAKLAAALRERCGWLAIRARKRMRGYARSLHHRMRRAARRWYRRLGEALVPNPSTPTPERRRRWTAWKRW